MQAVILAAGRGTRMGSLVENIPKPMLQVNGKNLLEYKLDALPDEVQEVIFIVGYKGEVIRNYFGSEFGGRRISYVEQEVIDGTAGALWRARDLLHDRFVVMMGDDIYAADDVRACIANDDWSLVVQATDSERAGGAVEVTADQQITGITEGVHGGRRFASTSLFVLDMRLFEFPMLPKAEGSTEFGLPQTVVAASQQSGIPFYAVDCSFWLQITAPEDLEKASELLK